jgi:hypothetical protein
MADMMDLFTVGSKFVDFDHLRLAKEEFEKNLVNLTITDSKTLAAEATGIYWTGGHAYGPPQRET